MAACRTPVIERRRWVFLKQRSDKVEALKRVPLMSDLSQSHLARIASLASERHEEAGSILAKQGSPVLEFFVILDGRARVEKGGKLLTRLAPGECFGEMSLIDFGPRSATVVAETPLVLLVIHTRSFQRLMRDIPALQRKLLLALVERLRRADAALSASN